jgi:hypothetical protein
MPLRGLGAYLAPTPERPPAGSCGPPGGRPRREDTHIAQLGERTHAAGSAAGPAPRTDGRPIYRVGHVVERPLWSHVVNALPPGVHECV